MAMFRLMKSLDTEGKNNRKIIWTLHFENKDRLLIISSEEERNNLNSV